MTSGVALSSGLSKKLLARLRPFDVFALDERVGNIILVLGADCPSPPGRGPPLRARRPSAPARIWRSQEGGASLSGGLLLALALSFPVLRVLGVGFL
jgi:hypothetical protein